MFKPFEGEPCIDGCKAFYTGCSSVYRDGVLFTEEYKKCYVCGNEIDIRYEREDLSNSENPLTTCKLNI